jgi:hypothetical protein
MSKDYLVIPNWSKLQVYKDRRPPWVKLHSEWLDDLNFRSLTRAEQGDYFKLFLIASKYEHAHIPNNRKFLREIGQIASKSIDKFIKLGLVRVQCDSESTDEDEATDDVQGNSASSVLASCKQDALPEGEGEGETETETETEQQGTSVSSISKDSNCESAEVLITGFNQLSESIPSPSPETPGRRQSRKNGPFTDVKNAVDKLLSTGVVEPTEINKIAKLAQISPKQVKEAIKQLREDGKQ